MRRLGLLGLCAGLMLALCGVMAAGAFAVAPEIGRCVKQTGGRFKDAGCTKEVSSKGAYEWSAGPVKFKNSTTGGKGVLETITGLGVECKTEKSVGEYVGTKEVTGVVVTFNECESAGSKCSTTGAKSGELVTKELEGLIGWQSKSAKKVAFDLYPKGKTGLFIEFSCIGLTVAVRGLVLVPISPVDKMENSLKLKYKAKKGIQSVEKFEGLPADILESSFRGGAYEQSGQTITATLGGEEPLEVNAVV